MNDNQNDPLAGFDTSSYDPVAQQPPAPPPATTNPLPVSSDPLAGVDTSQYDPAASPQVQSPVDTWGDIGKSARGQAILGLSDIASVPGMAASAANWATGYKPEGPPSLFGATYGNAYNRGDVVNFHGFPVPTAQGVERAVKQLDPTGWTSYEPQTEPGRLAGSAARFTTGALETLPLAGGLEGASLLGKVGNLGRTAATAAAAGAGSEAAGHILENEAAQGNAPQWAPAAARMAGALVGGAGADVGQALTGRTAGGIGSLARDLAAPAGAADRALYGALGSDTRLAKNAMVPQQVQQLNAAGYPTLAYDVLGPKGRALTSYYGNLSEEGQEALGDINRNLASRGAYAAKATADHIDNVFGGGLDAPATKDLVHADNVARNNRLYAISRTDPNAQQIYTPTIAGMAEAPPMQTAMQKAEGYARYPNSGIQGFQFNPDGSLASAPNLSYWDTVKRNLDDQVSSAKRQGLNDEASRLLGLKNALVGELDTAVPSYRTARNAAAEGFGAEDAPTAGYNSLAKMNAFSAADASKNFAAMTPEQQRLFGVGAGQYLKEVAATKGPGAVYGILSNAATGPRARMALGDAAYGSILDHSKMASDWASVKMPPAAAGKYTPPHGIDPGAAIALGAAGEVLGHGVSKVPLVGPALAYMGSKAYDAALGRRAASAAGPLVSKIGSSDPAVLSGIVSGAAKGAAAPETTTAAALRNFAARRALEATRANAEAQSPAYARGGKVNGHQHIVDRLMRAVEQARKVEENRTSAILKQPDEHVAKALNIAQEAI